MIMENQKKNVRVAKFYYKQHNMLCYDPTVLWLCHLDLNQILQKQRV